MNPPLTVETLIAYLQAFAQPEDLVYMRYDTDFGIGQEQAVNVTTENGSIVIEGEYDE